MYQDYELQYWKEWRLRKELRQKRLCVKYIMEQPTEDRGLGALLMHTLPDDIARLERELAKRKLQKSAPPV